MTSHVLNTTQLLSSEKLSLLVVEFDKIGLGVSFTQELLKFSGVQLLEAAPVPGGRFEFIADVKDSAAGEVRDFLLQRNIGFFCRSVPSALREALFYLHAPVAVQKELWVFESQNLVSLMTVTAEALALEGVALFDLQRGRGLGGYVYALLKGSSQEAFAALSIAPNSPVTATRVASLDLQFQKKYLGVE